MSPTVAARLQLGYPSLVKNGWFGVFAPAGTSAEVVAVLSRGIARSTSGPDTRAKMESMYLELTVDSTPARFSAFVREEVDKWEAVVKDLGVTAE